MRFAVLGPLTVTRDGIEIVVSSPVHRVLLAMLLLHANKPVSADLLVEAIWDGAPPATAKASLHNHVMRLRRTFSAAGERLVTRAPGYQLEVGAEELDLDRFTRLRESGRVAARQRAWPQVAAVLSEALSQWSGEPISNVRTSAPLAAEAQRLAELRLQTVELRLEAELQQGQPADAVGELRSLTASHPLRERFREQLMIALYAGGRQTEALAVYQDTRRTLVEQFGIEPGRRIQRLHQQILAADPVLPAESPADPSPAEVVAPQVVPRQLPASVTWFAGREAELRQLDRLLGPLADDGQTPPVIVAICGAAGVGKTTLAVHWAHRVSWLFPGGQIHLDLLGFAPAGRPVDLSDAIRCLLDALGVPAERIPGSTAAQVGLYRSLLAERERTLILLDNAKDAEHVRPMLPTAAGSLAIVTSRSDLTGLAAVGGAEIVSLGVMADAEARDLLAGRLGKDLIVAESAAVAELCVLCAGLPLTLTVAAARAALPSGPTLSQLVADLRDVRRRLDAFDTGDQASSIRAVLSWSYRCLNAPTARMFRLLGLQQGPNIGVHSAASLAGVDADQASRLLIELTRVHLLTPYPADRFGFHDLLRAYAAERAAAEEGEHVRHAALRRLFDHYLHTSETASLLLNPARDRLALGPPAPGVVLERFALPAEATAWFEAEHGGLLAAVFLARAAGFGEHVWQFAWVLSDFMERGGHWAEWARVQRAGLAAAAAVGNAAGIARAHRALGGALIQLGSPEEARSHLVAAQAAYQQTGDRVGQARVSLDLAMLAEQAGQDRGALPHAEHALALFTEVGHRAGQGRALNAVGWYLARLGDSGRAISLCERAVTLCAELGDQVGEAAAWDSLGYCHRQLGAHHAAIACCERAVELTTRIGDRYHQAAALVSCGDAHQAGGDVAAARVVWQHAAEILAELRHPDAEAVRKKLGGPNSFPTSERH